MMRHISVLSRERAPQRAISDLEFQAMIEFWQEALSQVTAFLSVMSGLKAQLTN